MPYTMDQFYAYQQAAAAFYQPLASGLDYQRAQQLAQSTKEYTEFLAHMPNLQPSYLAAAFSQQLKPPFQVPSYYPPEQPYPQQKQQAYRMRDIVPVNTQSQSLATQIVEKNRHPRPHTLGGA